MNEITAESSIERIERLIRSNQVVILNSGLEVVSVSGWQRGIELVVNNEAQIVAGRGDGQLIRSGVNSLTGERIELPKPLVVALDRWVDTYKPRVSEDCLVSKKTILNRDNHTCVYCGGKNKGTTVDHVIPQSQGGLNSWNNLVAACMPCNSKKADKSLKEVGFKVPSIPPLEHANFRLHQVEKAVKEYIENDYAQDFENVDVNSYLTV